MSLRLDRLLTLYFFGPLSRFRKPKGLRVPILMYHSISNERETRHPYYWINTSPARFSEHMKYLHDNGYEVIPLSTAVEMIRSCPTSDLRPPTSCSCNPQPVTRNPQPSVLSTPNTRHPTPRYVVLTFDDGYLDFYTHAFPILQQYGFTATVFLPTAFIDGKRPGIRGKEHLNWDQVRELYSAGIDFGSHTVNHPQLHDLDWPEIEYELRASKEEIESQLNFSSAQTLSVNRHPETGNGLFVSLPTNTQQSTLNTAVDRPEPGTRNPEPVVVASFCYPYKFPEQDRAFVSKLINLVSGSGYLCKVNTQIGSRNRDSDVFSLKRLPMNSADDVRLFSAKLAGNYDWISLSQRLYKIVKRNGKRGYVSVSDLQPATCNLQSFQPNTQHPTPSPADRRPVSFSVKDVRYVIITPVRDEEKYIQFTIDSVINQTALPTEWIIVNDGSTDRTGEIVDHAAASYPWIKAVHRENRGFRKAGGGVIDAFYEGYKSLHQRDWDFLVKLDGDLSFQADYFEKCFEKFIVNPKLGVGGGDIYNLIDGHLKLERQPYFHVRGATKIYKRDCWKAIGGLMTAPGWDTLDEVKANMLGWTTHSFPKLRVTHHRFTGGADGTWRNAVKNGLSDYICGYHPLFMIIKCLKRFGEKPYVLGAIGLLYGFEKGYLKGVSKVDDQSLIRYLRVQQLKRLCFKESIWK